MNLETHYNNLYNDAVAKIRDDRYETDSLIDSPLDKRFGITLLIRPDDKTKKEVCSFLSKLKEIEPLQYYYPTTDMHITVMSVISCYEGFNLSLIDVNDYVNVIQKSLEGIRNFNIEFKGLTASPSCVMVQGFPETEALNTLRDHLRSNFTTSNLQQTIDKRYSIQAAHSTIVRLRQPLTQKGKFLNLIEAHRTHAFGIFKVTTVELVFNDWYQTREKVEKLAEFNLIS
jgi:2'-5' RNA ligase